MNEIEAKARGLFFAGHYRDGVSLGDSIVSGVNIAERVGKLFEPRDDTDETRIFGKAFLESVFICVHSCVFVV